MVKPQPPADVFVPRTAVFTDGLSTVPYPQFLEELVEDKNCSLPG